MLINLTFHSNITDNGLPSLEGGRGSGKHDWSFDRLHVLSAILPLILIEEIEFVLRNAAATPLLIVG
jgi:hypothetical protein